MFIVIAEDEKRHLEMISQVAKDLDIKLKNLSPLKNSKTIFEKLKDEMPQRVEAIRDELEAFKIAMQTEREGVEFYKQALLHFMI